MKASKILMIAALAAAAFPQAASAATCTAGLTSEVATAPPAALAIGQVQTQNFTVTACTSATRITVEYVRVTAGGNWHLQASRRVSIGGEQIATFTTDTDAQGRSTMRGTTTFTVPAGAADGQYGVITRYYSATFGGTSEALGASSFVIATPPPVVTPDPIIVVDPPVVTPDPVVPIIATPTGNDPKPLKPRIAITKRANVKIVKTGGRIVYTITVRNTGQGSALAVRTCDKIPAGTVYVAHTGNAAFAAGGLCWNMGTMKAGAAKTVKVTVKVTTQTAKRIVNTACVTATNHAKRCATATVKVKVIRREPVGGVTG